jgi:ABC-type lipoprotein export system ATPase subunit
MSEPIVQLQQVDIFRGDFQVLNSITVDFPRGVTSVIMGPSGCGKSTLIKVAAGITPPDNGSVLINNKNINRISDRELIELRKMNGFVFQDGALWQNKTIFQNLSLPLEFHFRSFSREEIRRRIEDMVRKAGYNDSLDLRPSQLSSGERKIASIARALITDPSILFMDDPTTLLDRESSIKVAKIIKDMKEKKATIVITTHDPSLASMVADNLYILKKGNMLEHGKLSDVVKTRDKEVIAILTDVLSKTATYDTDILDLLETDE